MQPMQGSEQEGSGNEVEDIKSIGALLAEEMNKELRGDLHELEYTYTSCCDSYAYKHIHDDVLEMGLR